MFNKNQVNNNDNNTFNSSNLNYTEPYSNKDSYYNNNSNYNYNVTKEDNEFIKKWNWGAFMFNVIWGIGNKCYMPLLCLIPFVNIVMAFVCGACGNRWLWKTGQYKTPKEMYNIQKSWNTAGFVYFIISIICIALYTAITIYIICTSADTSYHSRYHY